MPERLPKRAPEGPLLPAREFGASALHSRASSCDLTYYALKTLATLPAGATYADWFKAITPTYLPTNQLPQNPQLFGSRTARAWKVFA